MGLIALFVIVFLVLGGVGIGMHGVVGNVLIALAVLWLVGGIGYHGNRVGWFKGEPRL